MIECDGLAERAEHYRMDAGYIACADRVHADFAFLPQCFFAVPAVNEGFGIIPPSCPANVLGQRQSAAAWGVFLETMVLLDDFYILFVAEH